MPTSSSGPAPELADQYLNLCKKHLTRGRFRAPAMTIGDPRWLVYSRLKRVLNRYGFELVRTVDPVSRDKGLERSSEAETMIGMKRLDNLQHCVTSVVREGVPGDLIETGVWRGGAAIFMRAVLQALGERSRIVWVADSFKGLPKPSGDYPADRMSRFWKLTDLAVPLEEVKANFASYGLLDDQVRFLEGWFSDTLPTAPFEQLAVLRLDGDMYESTMDALRTLYPKLSVGGYVIIDDYGDIPACRRAVTDFRAEHGIAETVHAIDWTGVYWRRLS